MNTGSDESDKSNTGWFIFGLCIIALVINSFCFGIASSSRTAAQQQRLQAATQMQIQQQQAQQAQVQLQQQTQIQLQQQQERERQQQIDAANKAAALKAAREAAARHEQYLARYLNGGFQHQSGMELIAVAVASDDGTFNQTVTRAIANHLKTSTVETLPAFFKPAFVSDGLINDAMNDASGLSGKLELTHSLDGLLLARETVDYSQNPSLDNVLTATMQLEVVAASVDGNAKSQTWTFTAHGADFKKSGARAMAEERIIKQINADTNISLIQTSP